MLTLRQAWRSYMTLKWPKVTQHVCVVWMPLKGMFHGIMGNQWRRMTCNIERMTTSKKLPSRGCPALLVCCYASPRGLTLQKGMVGQSYLSLDTMLDLFRTFQDLLLWYSDSMMTLTRCYQLPAFSQDGFFANDSVSLIRASKKERLLMFCCSKWNCGDAHVRGGIRRWENLLGFSVSMRDSYKTNTPVFCTPYVSDSSICLVLSRRGTLSLNIFACFLLKYLTIGLITNLNRCLNTIDHLQAWQEQQMTKTVSYTVINQCFQLIWLMADHLYRKLNQVKIEWLTTFWIASDLRQKYRVPY